jgi:DNA-binding transcriptional regulator GbsR (MarR family)
VRILLGETGRGQLEALSLVTEYEGSRQKKLVQEGTLSKGQVSSNLRKLQEKGLVMEEEKNYFLNKEELLKYYREHVETFLSRRSGVTEEKKQVRKICKERLEEILEKEKISKVLVEILKDARTREDLESLNSVFKEVDRVLREVPEKNLELDILIEALDTSNEYIDGKNTSQHLIDEVNK